MSIVFFLDRALGKYTFPDTLRDAGIRVERHCDHFVHDDPDTLWIARVAANGWYAVSQDRRIYRNPVERSAVLDSGLGYFVIPGGHLLLEELAINFVTNLPAILRFVERTERPFIASIQRPNKKGLPGRVTKLYPREG